MHYSLDFQINSQCLTACLTPERTIGGRAWPNFIATNRAWERPMALWSNTTLGLMSFWWLGTRQQQGRSNLTISRLPRLPVLDPRTLSSEGLRLAEDIFARFRGRRLLPANQAFEDEARAELDREILVNLGGLPEETLEGLAVLRDKWCREPSVHGGKATRPRS